MIGDADTHPESKMTVLEQRAWRIYCEESAGGMNVVDFWEQLGPNTRARFLEKARQE